MASRRTDLVVAVIAFVTVLVLLAVASYFGYDAWWTLVPDD